MSKDYEQFQRAQDNEYKQVVRHMDDYWQSKVVSRLLREINTPRENPDDQHSNAD